MILILPLWSVLSGCGGFINPLGLDADEDGVPYTEDCDDADPTVGANEQWRDRDGDSYPDEAAGGGCLGEANADPGYQRARSDGEWDCDDNDLTIHPLTVWYADDDSDGFGDPDNSEIQCEAPDDGYILENTDCDDTSAELFPGQVWYQDGDGDGFGNVAVAFPSCEPPEGYSLEETDCDDTESTTHPGADEWCDLIDNDCDGTIDEDDAVDTTLWFFDSDNDGYGVEDDFTLACPDASGRPPGGYSDLDGDLSPDNEFFSITWPWRAVSAGNYLTCGLRESGEVECWGNDDVGIIDNIPTLPDDVSYGFISIDMGYDTACGLLDNNEADKSGVVACWGDNSEPFLLLYNDFTTISAGTNHYCGLREGGLIACWGNDDHGQVGDYYIGSPDNTEAYQSVSAGLEYSCGVRTDGDLECWGDTPAGGPPEKGEDDFVEVSASGFYANTHACGLRKSGQITCWGSDSYGQVGDYAEGAGESPEFSDFDEVSAGGYHTCGLRKTGEITCWGLDSYGQVEDTPEDSDFTSVSAGRFNTCGVHETGEITCWGDDTSGESTPPLDGFFEISSSGNTSCARDTGKPTCWGEKDETPFMEFGTVSAGDLYTCGLDKRGSLFCWGRNSSSRPSRDDDVLDARLLDVDVGGDHFCVLDEEGALTCLGQLDYSGASFTSVSAGGDHACMLDEAGSITCDSTYSQIWDAPLGSNFTSVSAGGYHTCGVHGTGEVTCWGGDDSGQVGSYSEGLFADAAAVSAGGEHTCTLDNYGIIKCWGSDSHGQVGAFAEGSVETDFTAVSAGLYHTCGVHETGEVTCWGWDGAGLLEGDSASTDFTAVSAGDTHTCGLHESGDVTCWGSASDPLPFSRAAASDHLGRGDDFVCWLSPDHRIFCSGDDDILLEAPLGYFTSIAAGPRHACAIDEDGGVSCWGDDDAGQSSPPDTLSGITAVAPGRFHTCAASEDGVVCWGRDDEGQSSPSDITDGVQSIAAGQYHSCAVLNDGTPSCWGSDDFGQASPPEGSLFTAIYVGDYHSCGIKVDDPVEKVDDSVECWGLDNWGQVSEAPHYSFTQLSLGAEHSCGLKTDRQIACWGRDAEGQTDHPEL